MGLHTEAVSVRVVGLSKKFGNVGALDDVSFESPPGEILTLLGPSGCGKTTALRCIAGLENPDKGDIYIGDRLVTSCDRRIYVPPEKRGLSMVFQSYAIWPHMTVFDNIAYGLKLKKLSKKVIQEKVDAVLGLGGLIGLGERYPQQLSGGQQQRVALMRSIVLQPSVLLLDEPLSNLDFKLREQMRFELKEIQRKLGVTFIYVTHDQTEAIVISDKVIVMKQGKIEQMATPQDLYLKPKSQFVADFIGVTNFLTGKTSEKSGEEELYMLETEDGLTACFAANSHRKVGQKDVLSIRPHFIQIEKDKPAGKVNIWKGTIMKKVFLGDRVEYRVLVGKNLLCVHTDPLSPFSENQEVFVTIDPQHFVCLGQEDMRTEK